MYRLHLQYFEIFLKSVKSAYFNEIVPIFLEALNICLFTKIFQNVKIVMLQWNILQYLTKILRQYFNCNERLEIFLTCFCNTLCYVGGVTGESLTKLMDIIFTLRKNSNKNDRASPDSYSIFTQIHTHTSTHVKNLFSITFCIQNFTLYTVFYIVYNIKWTGKWKCYKNTGLAR